MHVCSTVMILGETLTKLSSLRRISVLVKKLKTIENFQSPKAIIFMNGTINTNIFIGLSVPNSIQY